MGVGWHETLREIPQGRKAPGGRHSSARRTQIACYVSGLIAVINSESTRRGAECEGAWVLTREEYAEARELHSQGWSLSAIARYLGRDRKTVRSYLVGGRTPGVRKSSQDQFGPFAPYCQQRLRDDPHLEATILLKEIAELGYQGGYSTLTRALRRDRLRPVCVRCRSDAPGQEPDEARADGDDLRFRWLTLPDPPPPWGALNDAHVLIGSLPGGRWRAVLAENEDLPQVVEAIDLVLRRLGRAGRHWRFEPTSAFHCHTTGRVKPELHQVARYYGVLIGSGWPSQRDLPAPDPDPLCPIADFWWRTVRADTRLHAAQERLDQLAAWLDVRHPEAGHPGHPDGTADPALPELPFPARIKVRRTITHHDLVPFRGNHYAVPPGLAGAEVEVRWRLGESHLSITTARGAVIARHTLAPRGAGRMVSGPGHTVRLERPQGRTGDIRVPCRDAVRPPLSPSALTHAHALRN